MGKICSWCGMDIVEEEGSIERRVFRKDGKDCSYFCGSVCEEIFIRNERERSHTGRPNTILINSSVTKGEYVS